MNVQVYTSAVTLAAVPLVLAGTACSTELVGAECDAAASAHVENMYGFCNLQQCTHLKIGLVYTNCLVPAGGQSSCC